VLQTRSFGIKPLRGKDEGRRILIRLQRTSAQRHFQGSCVRLGPSHIEKMANQSSGITCPSCHATELISRGKRNAFYPIGCLAIVGLPFAMLHQAASPMEYECKACRQRFSRRTLMARISLALLIAGVLMVVALIIFTVWSEWR
jgi:hypothetical protein